MMIPADWPAPGNIRAYSTTRKGGLSLGPFASLNLANPPQPQHHTLSNPPFPGDAQATPQSPPQPTDKPAHIAKNRARLQTMLHLPNPPHWLKQVHGNRVITITSTQSENDPPEADGAIATTPNIVLAILTADCLPVFLCNRQGTRIALLHAGWRGLTRGILAQGVHALACPPHDLLAHIGPAISQSAYEVDTFTADALRATLPVTAPNTLFRPSGKDGHWLADLPGVARMQLKTLGLDGKMIFGGGWCTFRHPELFFSHRRDGPCGRMGHVIWIAPGESPA